MCGLLTSLICFWATQLIMTLFTLSSLNVLRRTSSTQRQSYVNLTSVQLHFTLRSLTWPTWLKGAFRRPTGPTSLASTLSYQLVAQLRALNLLKFLRVQKFIKSISTNFLFTSTCLLANSHLVLQSHHTVVSCANLKLDLSASRAFHIVSYQRKRTNIWQRNASSRL